MRKGQLLKYLKKKVPLGIIEKSQETKRIVIKTAGNAATKDPQTSGSVENLNIVTFIRSDNEEKGGKYGRYATRKEEWNLRTKALGRYIFRILGEKNVNFVTSTPKIFTDEDLATIELLHADPIIIKLRIGDTIVSRVLVDGGSSSDVIFWSALRKMGVLEVLIWPVSTHIYAFDGTKVNPIGTIDLPSMQRIGF